MIEAGTRIADRYVVARVLGKGGMGTVYLARDERDARDVAIKMLRASTSSGAARRLSREARAMCELDPARIAQILDVGEMPDGAPYIVMEYVRGIAVRDVLERGRLETGEALRIVREMAAALGAAHRLGLVHRDVKPDNAMVREDGRVVLLDFGIVKRLERSEDAAHVSTQLTAADAFVGTPAYLAPEQALGRDVGPAADQFALGVMAFELLTGRLPWKSSDMTSLLAEILGGGRSEAESEVNPRLPRHVARVLWKALSPSPPARFATIEAFAAALEGASGSVDAGTEGAVEETNREGAPAGKVRARAPLPLLLGALAVVAVAAGATQLGRCGAKDTSPRSSSTSADHSVERPAFAVALDRSPLPEVARAYAAAMQAARDGALDAAYENLGRALALDPSNARAQLTFLMLGNRVRADAPARYQSVSEHRSTLDERERVLLDALEPLFRAEPDGAESVRRLRSGLEKSPGDGDLRYQLARVLSLVDDLGGAVRTLEEITRRDPTFALALQDIGFNSEFVGDAERASAAYEKCSAISASASKCLLRSAELAAKEGKCVEAETTSRKAIAASPDSPRGYELLADALESRGAPPSAVAVAVEEALKRASAEERPIATATRRVESAGWRGDFEDVLEATKGWEAALAGSNDAQEQFAPVEYAVAALIESGRRGEARARLERYLRRVPGWITAGPIDAETIEANGLLRHVGGLAEGEWIARREAWLAASKESSRLAWLRAQQWWWFAYAEPARDADDALAALAVLPRFPPMVAAPGRDPWYDASLGDVYRLAARYREALPYYRRSAAACTGDSFSRVRSLMGLGLASEMLGDGAWACAAYRGVLDLWGSARPRSITADGARAHVAALGCP
jgi:eukaryotic-like serine/threonine-protein kinase